MDFPILQKEVKKDDEFYHIRCGKTHRAISLSANAGS
jgi:hypothetical protein